MAAPHELIGAVGGAQVGSFDPDCGKLLKDLEEVLRQLPGGALFSSVRGGSSRLGREAGRGSACRFNTACRAPEVLDVVIYQEMMGRPAPGLEPRGPADPVKDFVACLLAHPDRFSALEPHSSMQQGVRPLLRLQPHALPLVKTVKRWARRHDLNPPGFGGYHWTVLCIFFLQQQGFLPSLESLANGQVPTIEPDHRELHQVIFELADFCMDYFQRQPRRYANLWFGQLQEHEVFGSVAGLPPTEEILKELRCLRESAGKRHPLGQLGGRQGGRFAAEAHEHEATGRTLSTPPPVARPPAPVAPAVAAGSAGYPAASGKAPRLPGSLGVATRWEAGRVSPTAELGWHIDENWIAHKTAQGRVVASVQLDPSKQGMLAPEGWAQRFDRREHQIRIGKGTREYGRWENYFLRYGRSEGEPVTPRAVQQTAKAAFEAEYTAWRVQLHTNPPA
ncbi:SLBP_RNA_bind domain-containing protein [Durusdinium trenchii]|uniref:SLBP_RNA_bind domain-containing protein n=1 Tax=Durusdinium trenchii TaxID=1381693 RepID=A0ABP0HCW9_9DINO